MIEQVQISNDAKRLGLIQELINITQSFNSFLKSRQKLIQEEQKAVQNRKQKSLMKTTTTTYNTSANNNQKPVYVAA